MFPLDRWYVAALSSEFPLGAEGSKPIARTLLGQPIVLFRSGSRMAALEDRCCHRSLPLSCGALEGESLRCSYHGLLYDASGRCIEIPGQTYIPKQACVRAYPIEERNQIIWIWMGSSPDSQPNCAPPEHPWHDDPAYQFKGDVYHYNAPYQLIHDNLLDLSHLGYLHVRTIGGNASIHANADMTVEDGDDWVRIVRHMPNSTPPPTYKQAWPFTGLIDRWQEIEFRISHFLIWTGGMDAASGDLRDPARHGFHLRGFHGITPETEASSFYFWTISSNLHPTRTPEENAAMKEKIHRDTALTFQEDQAAIEAQFANIQRFPDAPMVGIQVDAAPNRARRIITRLCKEADPVPVG